MLAIWSLVPLPSLNPACTSLEVLSSYTVKPNLNDFEHYLVSIRNEHSCVVVWTFFGTALLWDWNENWHFPVPWHLWIFQICWHIECNTFTASPFRIWNSSAGIISPPLTSLIVMLPKSHLTLPSRMTGSRWVITPSWLSGSLRPFLHSSVYSCHLFNLFCLC